MPYLDIVQHYENCFKKYGDNHKGVDWPNKSDADVRYRVMLDVMKFDPGKIDRNTVSLLDFGCGLGHLYQYILEHDIGVAYTGLDASALFVEKCKEKFPSGEFLLFDLLENEKSELPQKYNYIILNGVFTEKREMGYEAMLDYFKKMIIKLYYNCTRGGVAFNVMSKDVDWEREDLFHLPLNVLSNFLTKEVTRDFIIRYDYGLYEYTTYLYKK